MSTTITTSSNPDVAYMKYTDAKISYTLPIDEGVLADYDENGAVVGVEIIHASKATNLNWSALYALANRKTMGTARKPTPKMQK